MIARVQDRGHTLLNGRQVGLILAVDDLLSLHALTLVCPTCAKEGRYGLDASNGGYDLEWKVDCPCRTRRARPSETQPVTLSPGEALQAAARALSLAGLALRCRRTRACLQTDPTWSQSDEGLVLACTCGERTFPSRPGPRWPPAGAAATP